MKKFVSNFFLRGLLAASSGPMVLAIIYGVLGATGTATSFTYQEVCAGILTITLLALLCGGMTAIYQVERLPLPTAILLHGGALYIGYILTYLFNGWLQQQLVPILVFTAIFLVGYGLIWAIIYVCIKAKTDRINQKLQHK